MNYELSTHEKCFNIHAFMNTVDWCYNQSQLEIHWKADGKDYSIIAVGEYDILFDIYQLIINLIMKWCIKWPKIYMNDIKQI